MKLAILLPGYIESPDYHHLIVIDKKLSSLGYTVVHVDACNLWSTGDGNSYSTTNYINQVKTTIDSYLPQNPSEIILIGHSLGCLVALYLGKTCRQVTKVICLSPPVALDKSDHKWVNGFRVSKKDLPGNPTEFRQFSVPYSFVADRLRYSIVDTIKGFEKPFLIVIGEDDSLLPDVENLVKDQNIKNFIKIANMGHDFRQSDDLCNQVASEIEKFV